MADPAELAAQYGFTEAFFRADPELWALFSKAKAGQWTAGKWQAEFMKTQWFRSREASMRQWSDLTTRDPAEAQNKITERAANISDRFTQMGITIDEATLTMLASQSLQYSWSEDQMNNVIGSYVHYTPGATSGGIAEMENQINTMAYQFGVSVTSEQMQNWIQGLVNKSFTDDNVTDFIRDAAKSKYAGLTPQLDSGRTTRDIAGQHIAEYSRLLEMDPGNVNLDDPILARALQGTVDPRTGLPQSQTVFQMSQDVKKDSRWLGTKNARDDMMGATYGILQDMGLM